MGQRIAKILARAGLASRRAAERAIAQGRVHVDGERLTTAAVLVESHQQILFDGKAIPDAPPPKLYSYHKARGTVCTHTDPQRRPTIYAQLPPALGRVQSVGRLDINSEGLLLLTNHGGLKRQLELPANGWARRYRVRAFGTFAPQRLAPLRRGVVVKGVRYQPVEVRHIRTQGGNVWLEMTLREGKNREIKNLLDAVGLEVNRLIRVQFGPFALDGLAPGAIQAIAPARLEQVFGKTWQQILDGRA